MALKNKTNIKENKKAFAFTMLAFFLIFLIFTIGSLILFSGSYANENLFKESRILSINSEIQYFKDVYIKNAISYSSYGVLESLLNYSRTNYTFSQDYKEFNRLFSEGLLNGSFDSIDRPELSDKNLGYLFREYQETFSRNYRGDLDFKVNLVGIYDLSPYYISVQINADYNITTYDKISFWDFNDDFVVSVPVSGLYDPEFLLSDSKEVPITPAENTFGHASAWSHVTLNETILNMYASIHEEPFYKYTIGKSFLNRFLNFSVGAMKDVIGFWNFDYDLVERGVYDRSRVNLLGEHFGNSILVLNFNDMSDLTNDLSAYNTLAQTHGNPSWVNDSCISMGCLKLDGIDDYINISDNLNLSKDISISIWAKSNATSCDNINTQVLMADDASGRNGLRISQSSCELLSLKGNSSYDAIKVNLTDYNISHSDWNHYVVVSSDNGLFLYLNGIFVSRNTNNFTKLAYTNAGGSWLEVGHARGNSGWYFDGLIDEFSLYSKALSNSEIADLYEEKRALLIDYKDSLYGSGIEFDGINDYINISLDDFTGDDFSFSIWIKPYNNIGNIMTFDSEFALSINSSEILVSDNKGNETHAPYNFELGEYLNIIGIYSSLSNKISLYINSEFIKSSDGSWNPDGDGGIFTVGSGKYPNNGITGAYFNGIIDEIKIYNRSLTKAEIDILYSNFDSAGKACCNYIIPINPHLLGYNTTLYNGTIPYSSKLFYDIHRRGIPINVSLFNSIGFTSQREDENFYNFRIDDCMAEGYNAFSDDYDPYYLFYLNYTGKDSGNCTYLIEQGIY